MSVKQGVLAVVYDGINYLINKNLICEEYLPSKTFRIQWGLNVLKIEKVADKQNELVKEFGDLLDSGNIKTLVLKGFALAVLYPKANHRPCGDFDCFLCGDYEKGNNLAVENGAVYGGCDVKHAHLNFKGLEIENHKFFTNICGAKKKKDFERNLHIVLYDQGMFKIEGTSLFSPNSLFTALFLTEHSWRHFMAEEIGLRHICDWAIFLKHYYNDLNWSVFCDYLNVRDENIVKFATCISLICNRYWGIPLPSGFGSKIEYEELTERILKSILYDNYKKPSAGRNFFSYRYNVIMKLLRNNWRKKEFCEDSAINNTINFLYEHIFERHPHL